MGNAGSALELENVAIEYSRKGERSIFRAVQDATFSVAEKSFVSLVGPSGCGKSSLLYAVAGLLPYTSGTIAVDGKPVEGPGRDRSVVFQAASLLPWKTALRNVSYGLELRGVGRAEAMASARPLI